ncbi:predicted protein [Plenodomus lingam JN3]|uniref:Predicted protein n=1 Tax=Leptosphaeria maculans (strain JN3 / isolate v23.1.3 / race Av1-4-5-6-7-8) TaxID=985895 RepID=E5AC62_LEPMJ|nr:predicted protein [Plenodomus lingam JN3]CBY00173.1 predicted protein [Plenodomus lingam JN3]
MDADVQAPASLIHYYKPGTGSKPTSMGMNLLPVQDCTLEIYISIDFKLYTGPFRTLRIDRGLCRSSFSAQAK